MKRTEANALAIAERPQAGTDDGGNHVPAFDTCRVARVPLRQVAPRTPDLGELITLAVRYHLVGVVDASPVPEFIRAGLRCHARSGNRAARAVLAMLDDTLEAALAAIEARAMT